MVDTRLTTSFKFGYARYWFPSFCHRSIGNRNRRFPRVCIMEVWSGDPLGYGTWPHFYFKIESIQLGIAWNVSQEMRFRSHARAYEQGNPDRYFKYRTEFYE